MIFGSRFYLFRQYRFKPVGDDCLSAGFGREIARCINRKDIIYTDELGFMPTARIGAGIANEATGRCNQKTRCFFHAELIDDFIELRCLLFQKEIDGEAMFGLRFNVPSFHRALWPLICSCCSVNPMASVTLDANFL